MSFNFDKISTGFRNPFPTELVKWVNRIERMVRYLLIVAIGYLVIANILLYVLGDSVTGTVVDFYNETTQSKDRQRTVHRPIFEYAYHGVNDWRLRGSFGEENVDYKIGDQVEILVNRLNPNHAEVNSFMELWFFPILWLLLAAIIQVFRRVLIKMFGGS